MSDCQQLVAARGLRKSYGNGPARNLVLHGLDLEVRRGEFVAIMGQSGCGKSTLLHVLGLMTPPDEGSILIDGQDARDPAMASRLRRRQIGFVFQRFNLLGVLSAKDNVAISLNVRGLSGAGDGYVEQLFGELGVSHLQGRKPSAMSVGEQQRVAVVRAIAHRPSLLLADEPTGNLDSQNAIALLEIFQRINRQQHQTIIMITHSIEAARFAGRVVHMKDGLIVDDKL